MGKHVRVAVLGLCLVLGFVFAGLPLARSATASDPATWATILGRANQMYEQGRYDQAISLYEQIVDSGMVNGRVYYNLGNAHFKAGHLGKAIVSYERARRLMPRDEDTLANLEIARSRVQGGPVMPDAGAAWSAISGLHLSLRPDETAWIAWGIFLAMVLLGLEIIFFRLWPRLSYALLGILGVALVISLASFVVTVYEWEHVDRAVVIAPEVSIYSGPGPSYTLQVTLGEGSEVILEERRDGWCRLQFVGDMEGWTSCDGLELVRPQSG